MVGAALDLEDFAALGARPVVTIEKIKHCCQKKYQIIELGLRKSYVLDSGRLLEVLKLCSTLVQKLKK